MRKAAVEFVFVDPVCGAVLWSRRFRCNIDKSAVEVDPPAGQAEVTCFAEARIAAVAIMALECIPAVRSSVVFGRRTNHTGSRAPFEYCVPLIPIRTFRSPIDDIWRD